MISLAAILFIDIVRSTELAAQLRDERWNRLRRTHDALVRKALRELGGREINTAGDAFLATFDEPEIAIQCASRIRETAGELGLEIRTGIHFGRLERTANDVGGIALHIAARVAVTAEPGEILVSSTVHDALVGSRVDFEDRGLHALKGLPGEWRLYSVREVPDSGSVTAIEGREPWVRRVASLARAATGLRRRAEPSWHGPEYHPSDVGAPDRPAIRVVPSLSGPDRIRPPTRAPRDRVGRTLSQRLGYAAICAVVLAVGVWGITAQRDVSRLSPISVLDLEYPVRVDAVQVGSRPELDFVVQRYASGSTLRLIDARGRAVSATTVPRFSWMHLLVTAICGLAFWAVGTFVFAPRMERGYIPAFFWAFMLYATAIFIGGVHFPREPIGVHAVLPLLRISSLILLPFLFIYIFLLFPRRDPLIATRRWLVPAASAIALILVAWHGAAFLEYVLRPRPEAWNSLRGRELLAGAVLIAGDVTGCVFLYRNVRRAELDREKRQANWILWGMATGVTPFAFLFVLPQMLGSGPVISLAVARLATITIPVAFGIAVAKYKFLDIDIIIRRSLIYATLAALAAGLYLLLAVWAARHVPPAAENLLLVVATAGVVALVRPTRRAIGRWVDRTFFKISYRHGRALRSLRQRLERVWSQREVAGTLRRFLDDTLRPRWAAVVVRAGDDLFVSEGGDDIVGLARGLWDSRPELLERPLLAPQSTTLPEREDPAFPLDLFEAGVLLAYPLSSASGRLGWILIGEKESERRFVREDLALLDDVAAEAGTALEHLDLVNRVAEERLARQKLKDLERSKSEFLMRVAHDLRTPLASISWSAQNLVDGVVGQPDPRHASYLRAITTSTHRLARLVENLLEVSRLDGIRRLESGPIELSDIVQEAIDGLLPLAESRDQRFEVRADGQLPPAHGNRPALVEVATNLLENALKYSPDGATVEIEVAGDHGQQTLSIHDRGPGLGDLAESDLFGAFRQGAPSPHTGVTGFGLGLFIVRSYVEMLGGKVSGSTDPTGGARFTVTLHDWEREPART